MLQNQMIHHYNSVSDTPMIDIIPTRLNVADQIYYRNYFVVTLTIRSWIAICACQLREAILGFHLINFFTKSLHLFNIQRI